jgi:hypothetical protein
MVCSPQASREGRRQNTNLEGGWMRPSPEDVWQPLVKVAWMWSTTGDGSALTGEGHAKRLRTAPRYGHRESLLEVAQVAKASITSQTVGDHCVIAMGAVVTRDVPARVIGDRRSHPLHGHGSS